MEPFLAFSYSSSLTIQVENTRDGKAKIQTTRWCVWNVFILLKSKNYMFIYVRIPKKKKISMDTLNTIIAKQAQIFLLNLL